METKQRERIVRWESLSHLLSSSSSSSWWWYVSIKISSSSWRRNEKRQKESLQTDIMTSTETNFFLRNFTFNLMWEICSILFTFVLSILHLWWKMASHLLPVNKTTNYDCFQNGTHALITYYIEEMLQHANINHRMPFYSLRQYFISLDTWFVVAVLSMVSLFFLLFNKQVLRRKHWESKSACVCAPQSINWAALYGLPMLLVQLTICCVFYSAIFQIERTPQGNAFIQWTRCQLICTLGD